MKYLVLVSHGGLAEGLKSSLAMFAGDKNRSGDCGRIERRQISR